MTLLTYLSYIGDYLRYGLWMSLTTTSREERLRARDSARQAAAAAQLQAAEAAKALADAERECPVDVPPAIEAAKLTALVQSVGGASG